ncbi:MAG TPA: hypothetical protein VGW75_08900 [Solirubrobacteraceae bacterium]|jgi:hypothetical protein|nr:hypothetical protein [Solirubrobacteraceae bacterium]
MTRDALDEVRANLLAGIAARRRRSRTLRRRAFAAVAAAAAGIALAAVLTAGDPEGGTALAIERHAQWIEVRLVDPQAPREDMASELRAAGIDAEVRLVPAGPDQVGTWIGAEIEPPNVHAPSPEDAAQVGWVRIDNRRDVLRVRVDFEGRIVLAVGRARFPGERLG